MTSVIGIDEKFINFCESHCRNLPELFWDRLHSAKTVKNEDFFLFEKILEVDSFHKRGKINSKEAFQILRTVLDSNERFITEETRIICCESIYDLEFYGGDTLDLTQFSEDLIIQESSSEIKKLAFDYLFFKRKFSLEKYKNLLDYILNYEKSLEILNRLSYLFELKKSFRLEYVFKLKKKINQLRASELSILNKKEKKLKKFLQSFSMPSRDTINNLCFKDEIKTIVNLAFFIEKEIEKKCEDLNLNYDINFKESKKVENRGKHNAIIEYYSFRITTYFIEKSPLILDARFRRISKQFTLRVNMRERNESTNDYTLCLSKKLTKIQDFLFAECIITSECNEIMLFKAEKIANFIL